VLIVGSGSLTHGRGSGTNLVHEKVGVDSWNSRSVCLGCGSALGTTLRARVCVCLLLLLRTDCDEGVCCMGGVEHLGWGRVA
jgi:hypothetical protein